MIIKQLSFLLIPLAIAVTLLNITLFQIPSLSSFFFYSILSCLFGIIVFIRYIIDTNRRFPYLPLYIKTFIVLSIYVVLHGHITNTLGLTHYYWIVNAIFLTSIYLTSNFYYIGVSQKKNNHSLSFYILIWIAVLAVFESIVVLFQFINILKVKKDLFPCTGTWGNPNVTAMFLAMCLFSLFYLKKRIYNNIGKVVIRIALLICLNAIIYLQCRSAYLVSIIVLLSEYGVLIKSFLRKNSKLDLKSLAICTCILIGLVILFSVFTSKKASTASRISIWKSSISIIKEKPFTGYGFGLFEKRYNIYSAEEKKPINDHINYAYNDFLELGIEGGILAPVLWLSFLLFAAIHYYRQRDYSINMMPVLISFITLQLTNFGFQAIPAYVVFIVYLGIFSNVSENHPTKTVIAKKRTISRNSVFLLSTAGFLLSLFLCIKIILVAKAFYQNALINKMEDGQAQKNAFSNLGNELKGVSIYYENYGNSGFSLNEYDFALAQYQFALQGSSNPDLLLKMGYCYQMKGMYDSSQLYYTRVANMQPHKYVPQFFLLRLFIAKEDIAMVISKAEYILEMPIKVMSKRVAEIKYFSKEILKKYIKESSLKN